MPDVVTSPANLANSYVSVEDANTYLEASKQAAEAWKDVALVDKQRCLITAARMLERQLWEGEQTDPKPTQALAHPRTGMTDKYKQAVDSVNVHQQVKDAQIELAFAISQEDDVESSKDANSNTKKVVADTVSVEFFAPIRDGGRFPSIVQELIEEFLAGAEGASSVGAFGTECESKYSEDDWQRNRGFS